ncbi:MAG: 2Fe-2S iron-sulfur cluster-binding protein, partial [Runella sp.]
MLPVLTSSVVVFIVIIFVLAYLILLAQQRLLPQKEVSIIINGNQDSPITVKPGASLLATLSGQNLFLPSACGGGGTCAMCKCQVFVGGGEVLPTETNHLNRRQVQDKVRLACQVKVKEDMEIRIPDEVFGIKKWECTVVSNDNVSTYIKEFVVKLPEGENLKFRSGDYIQIDVPAYQVDFQKDLYQIPERFKDEYDKFK